MRRYRDYQEDLMNDLKDPQEAAAYLNAVLEDGNKDVFLIALRNVVEAHGGMTKIARHCKLHRVSLYKILSKNGNPEIWSLMAILNAVGIKHKVEEQPKKLKRAA